MSATRGLPFCSVTNRDVLGEMSRLEAVRTELEAVRIENQRLEADNRRLQEQVSASAGSVAQLRRR